MHNIVYGLYNQLKYKSEAYQSHLREITMFHLSNASVNWPNNYPIMEDTVMDALISRAADPVIGAKHLMIVSMGHELFDHKILDKIIAEAEAGDYAMLGHILEDCPQDPETGFYQLHPQCLYINLEKWRALNKTDWPIWGEFEGPIWNLSLPRVLRSPDNIHDDYTPTYLLPTGEMRDYYGTLKQGWRLIASFLEAGYRVGNFSNDIRRTKIHLYPDVDDDCVFERILAGDETLTVPESGPTYGQFSYLRRNSKQVTQNSVFVFNNEKFIDYQLQGYVQNKEVDTVYSVAAGFIPLEIFNKVGGKRIVFVDYSQPALDFHQWLYERWDGYDYANAIYTYQSIVGDKFRPMKSSSTYEQQWQEIVKSFGGIEVWLALWNRYRATPVRFIKTNFFEDYQAMIDDMSTTTGNNVFWFSNSFYTPLAIRYFQPDNLYNIYDNFRQQLKDANQSIVIMGTNPYRNLERYGDTECTHFGILK